MAQRILIADDVEDNRLIYSTLLIHHGYEVVLAANGSEAVAQAKLHAPDLVLMDLQMPVVDGWEATRLLRADPATASIPIVALTAFDLASPQLREAGFCAYVRKPFLGRDLLGAVEMCLEAAAAKRCWVDVPPMRSLLDPTM